MNQLFGLLLIIIIIAFGAFFIQSGQAGVLNFGKISFGVPLSSLGNDPIIKYQAPGSTGVVTKTGGSTSGKTTTGGSSLPSGYGTGSGQTQTLPQMPVGSPSPRFSEFYGRVKLGSVSAGSAKSLGQVSLRAVFTGGEKINVTGWYLKATHGGWYVPQAVNIYDSTGLAEPGDIYLGRGETVNMYSTVSPVGVNFRLNSCTGYLANNLKFSPSLPRQCPGADTATLRNFSSQCQDYVPSAVGGCKEPKSSPPIPYYDDACRTYLQQFTFKGCFSTYRSEPNFLKPEWRVWMGSTFLNPRHDRLFVLDKNGFVVDWKEY